jgi:serine/threonine protein kinase
MLTKDPVERPTAFELLKHPFLHQAEHYKEEFAQSVTNFMTLKRQQQQGK